MKLRNIQKSFYENFTEKQVRITWIQQAKVQGIIEIRDITKRGLLIGRQDRVKVLVEGHIESKDIRLIRKAINKS